MTIKEEDESSGCHGLRRGARQPVLKAFYQQEQSRFPLTGQGGYATIYREKEKGWIWMKKNFFAGVILILMLLLAACGRVDAQVT